MDAQPGTAGGRREEKPYAARPLSREQRWLELWSYAQVRLGLSRAEFFLLQARQLDALIRQDRNEIEHREFMLAQIAAAVINGGMRAPEKLVSVDELMPSRARESRRDRPVRMNARQRRQVADEWKIYLRRAAENGGTVITKEQQAAARGQAHGG